MSPPDVDICVCTYRRASLAATLASLAALAPVPGLARLRVVVADNDGTEAARAGIEAEAARLGLSLAYVHAPAQNISIARNACLTAATAPLIAFIDDDETADPAWLLRLVAAAQATGADVVFGPVRALYGADAPAWARAADLHSIRPTLLPQGRIATGYSCNVLIRREVLGGLRFDPALGRSGGEDTWFFHRLAAGGARLAFCPDAWTYEPVARGRARLAWLLRRSFRSGQTHARILLDCGQGRGRALALAGAKLLACAAGAAASLASAPGWRRWAVRGALHAGVMARLLGRRDLEIY
jgi:succinoglycan biosynthesis protein ExoM